MAKKTLGTVDAPPLRSLQNEQARALVLQVRDAVAPILANNILNHFTDHSASHSDSVCDLVDDLIAGLQQTAHILSDDELVAIYSACYLHDVGMQYENAGATNVIQGIALSDPWDRLDEPTRRDYLRRYHHLISAELVAKSVGSANPPIGLQLTDAYSPSAISRLCEAHCVPPDSPRYSVLMQEMARLRMPLLSAVLRLADILDESRHRAVRGRVASLMLNLESQTHWWRHYYTKDIKVNAEEKTITIWFEFPKDHVDEYERVVPEIQTPWIRKELEYHRVVFNEVGMGWDLIRKIQSGPYSHVDEMPAPVMTEMLKQLHRRRIKAEEHSRAVVVRTFKEARPHVERQLKALRERKDTTPAEQYIVEMAALSCHLWELGSRRSAWMALSGPFVSAYATLQTTTRLDIGARLLQMLMDDGVPEMARQWAQQFATDAAALPLADEMRGACLAILARWYDQMCFYEEAVATFRQAIASAATPGQAGELTTEMREIDYLQGNVELVLRDVGELERG